MADPIPRNMEETCFAQEHDFKAQPVHSADSSNFDLVCIICEELMTDPKVMNCQSEHMACSACLNRMSEKYQSETLTCPFDSEVFVDVKEPSMAIKRAIGNVQVYCNYNSRGCEWEGAFSNVEEHLRINCDYTPVPCVNADCPYAREETRAEWPIRKEWENHKEECQYKEVSCEYCSNLILLVEMNRHYEECLKFPVTCPSGCDATKILREDVKKHLDVDCPEMVVNCVLKKHGCEHIFKRAMTFKHMQECANDHIILMMAKLDLHEEKLQEQEEYINSFNTIVFQWRLESFSDIKENLIKSETCEFEGMQWHLELYPNGIAERNNGHVSLFLHGHSRVYEQEAVSIEFEFRLLGNEKYSGKDVKLFPRRSGWGWAQFISRSALSKRGFLSDGALNIECSITLKGRQSRKVVVRTAE